MSLSLDTGNFKDAYIRGIRVREMWLRGNLIYIKKKEPTVTLAVSKGDSPGKIVLTGQFEDYGHRYRYFDEATYTKGKLSGTHGFLSIRKFGLGNRVLTLSTQGASTGFFQKYTDDGAFSHTIDVPSVGLDMVFRAWVYYTDGDTGKKAVAYSRAITGSYNSI